MSQHDFNIANQSFPATRTDLNNALVALASNSSGDAEPATKYANQWWYETDTNTLKLRNEANDAWISIAVLDQSGNAVQSITTAGLTLGSTAISATGTEINQLDAITRGSILYGNASGATARLAAGGASTVLTSDGTDISWAAAAGGGGGMEFLGSSGAISNAATVDFTSKMDASKYDSYKFFFHSVIPATAAVTLGGQLSADNGSSYDTTQGSYHKIEGFSSGTSDLSYLQIATTMEDTAGGGYSGEVQIFNAGSSSSNTLLKQDGLRLYGGGSGAAGDFRPSDRNGSYVASTAAHNAIRFLLTSGNIASGEITMFGIVNS